MAVGSRPDKPPEPIPMIKDYSMALKVSMRRIAILPGIMIGLICAIVLILTGVLPPTAPDLWIYSFLAGFISVSTNMIIFMYANLPISNLLTVIAHVSGEPIHGALPNPHDKRFTKSGLGTAIRAIYALDSSKIDKKNRPMSSDIAAAPVDRIQGAIIGLDRERAVTYASKSSPTETIDGKLRPQLLFQNSDSLDAWLDECEHSSVKAQRIWRRVPDRSSDQEEVRIYDVYATYERGAEYETIILLVDQTKFYESDENDLNFIAFAAHELRGPITVVRGYIDVLQEELQDVLTDEQQELFYRLVVSSNRLSGYINNILNTSRYDQRHLSVQLTEDSIAHIYDTIRDDMTLRASLQNRILNVDIPEKLPTVAADRASLSEVFSNLIDNAIKYSSEGGVISVKAERKGDRVEIHVIDRGIGMPANVVSNLFHKFYRSHRSRETVAGSGIGLYISKAIVESHGGNISVRSAEGSGSTFTVSIPTYASVADKLAATDNSNAELIQQGSGWIKNHSMYRG